MSTIESVVSTDVSTATTATATTTPHAAAAQARMQELRGWRELNPHFILPVSADERQRLSAAASLPPEFIELSAVAVANETALVRGDGVSPDETRDLMSYAEAYGPVADALEAAAQFVRHSVTAARNRAGGDALITYALAQRLAKKPKTAHLATYVADMRRALGRAGKLSAEKRAERAAKKAAAQKPPVTPPAVPDK